MTNEEKLDYLDKNEKFLIDLKCGLYYIKNLAFVLNLQFKIDISQKPWYKNIKEIYVPQAMEFYENCKNSNFDILEKSDKWMRSSFKSFISEIEKFIKFIIKIIFNLESNTFYNAIHNLKNIFEEYKNIFDVSFELEKNINEIIKYLNNLRLIQNKNKHEDEILDSNCFFDSKENKVLVMSSNILEYIKDAIYRIISVLLSILIIILKNKSTK